MQNYTEQEELTIAPAAAMLLYRWTGQIAK
jgi:hypothetical protein